MPRPQGALVRLTNEFGQATSQLHLLIDGLPEDLWARRNDPTSWSVAECVAHLNLTSSAFLPVMRDAVERARVLPARPGAGYRRDVVGWIISALSGPLPRFAARRIGRVRTPAAFVPGADLQRAWTMDEFDRLQAEQVVLLGACEGLPIDRVKIKSPFDRRLEYSLYSALVALPRHQQRHIQQAEAVWA